MRPAQPAYEIARVQWNRGTNQTSSLAPASQTGVGRYSPALCSFQPVLIQNSTNIVFKTNKGAAPNKKWFDSKRVFKYRISDLVLKVQQGVYIISKKRKWMLSRLFCLCFFVLFWISLLVSYMFPSFLLIVIHLQSLWSQFSLHTKPTLFIKWFSRGMVNATQYTHLFNALYVPQL